MRSKRILSNIFDDVWKKEQPVSWLDIGAGYGELLQAVTTLAPVGSNVEGVEPMAPKASVARRLGLHVTEGYLSTDRPQVDIISMMDIFSHIPNFAAFLSEVRTVLKPGGEVLIETGNLADLKDRKEFAGELGLPDHLAFAGERHLRGFLERSNFEIVRLVPLRTDGIVSTAKTIVKKALGRPVILRAPYSSAYRQLVIRARLR